MGNKKKKSKASSNGHRPRNGSRPSNAHVATAALGRRVERSSTGSPNHNLRTYEIPDFRLEHPQFSVRQLTEKDKPAKSTSATKSPAISTLPSRPSATPNISTSSKPSRSTATCCSTAKWRSRSKISTSKAKSSAESTSDSARKPAPAPPPTRSTKTTGSRP